MQGRGRILTDGCGAARSDVVGAEIVHHHPDAFNLRGVLNRGCALVAIADVAGKRNHAISCQHLNPRHLQPLIAANAILHHGRELRILRPS